MTAQRVDITLVLRRGLAEDTDGITHNLTMLIRRAVARGDVSPGERLPPSRKLAADLGIARGTVGNAIDTLVAEGLLETRVGAGTFVAEAAACLGRPVANRKRPAFKQEPRRLVSPDIDGPATAKIDFRPCRPSLAEFPLKTWRRSVSFASASLPSPDYGDAKGQLALREAVCDYLRRARGLNTSPNNVIVTNGALHAMHLATTLYLERGSRVVVENPGYPLARQMFENAGAEVLTCPVDEHGLITEELPRKTGKLKFVYVTPSHQFPTGSRLSLARRRALIDWAERCGVLILEDDYDGEFRYDVPPLVPMAAMDNHCVIYFGTFSKTMFPGLRIGFAVGPRSLIDAMAALRTFSEYAPNDLNQRALAHFIENNHYERHIHRMRRVYGEKRAALAKAVDELGVGADLVGIDSGLNAMVRLPEKLRGRTVAAAARKDGVLVPSILRYAASRSIRDDALIVGYAAPAIGEIREGVRSMLRAHAPA